MKKTLKIVIYVIAAVQAFMTLAMLMDSMENLFDFITVLISGIVAIVPYICIALLLKDQEELETRVYYLENENIINDIKQTPIEPTEVPEIQKGRRAIIEWTCPKCGTVNKANTTNCEHCGAAH